MQNQIKVKPNVLLHQALTEDELDLHAFFGEEDSDAVSEYSLISEEEEDPFTPAVVKNLLCNLADSNKQQAKLQEDAAKNRWEGEEYPKKLQKRCSSKLWVPKENL